ncbi:MAG: O-antigen ligase family protein [Bacilli bacterium]
MNKNDKLVDRINYIIMVLLIIGMPIINLIKIYSVYFFRSRLFLNFDFVHILWFLLPIMMLITLYNIKQKRIKKNIFTILITIIMVLMVVSTIFAINKTTAIYGIVNRNEGLLSILAYYFIMLNCMTINRKNIYKLINIFIGCGLLQVIYAVLQVVFRVNFVMKFPIKYMASGLIGNPNFFGSYMILLIGLTIGLYFFSKKYNKFYFIASLLFLIGLILSESTGPFLSFIILFGFIIILFAIKKIKLKKVLILAMACFITFAFTNCFTQIIFINIFNDEINMNYSISSDMLRIFGISSEKISEITGVVKDDDLEFASGRMVLWQKTLEIVPKYPLTGVGLDNLFYVFPQIWGGSKIDKAHNEYLQLMVTTGIPTVVVYLSLLFLIFLKGIFTKDKLITILLLSFVGYSIQAFANISIVEVAPYYFMISGFIIGLDNNFKFKEIKSLFHCK